MSRDVVVVDASAFVDVLVGSDLAGPVTERLRGRRLVAPAHFDAEVLSALGRLARGGALSDRHVADRLRRTAAAPVRRDDVAPLLPGAWRRRHDLRLVDALYVELAHQLGALPLVTTDGRLAAATPLADLVTVP